MNDLDDIIYQLEELKRQIKCWVYLFEEQQRISKSFRDLVVKYKDLLDEKN